MGQDDSDRAAIKDLLLADIEHFGESMWRNEEVGEKRFSFLVTLATAVAAGLVALTTSDPPVPAERFRRIAIAAIAAVLFIGLLSYLRMLRRNRVSDQYQRTLGYIRRKYAALYPGAMPEYKVPRPETGAAWNKWIAGGYVETVSVLNGMLVSALLVVGFGAGPAAAALAGVTVAAGLWSLPQFLWPRIKTDAPEEVTFRAGAGAVVADANGQVLAFERSDTAGAWQFPQGGLHAGEEPLAAALRELHEETGLRADDVELLDAYPDPLAYVLPPDARSSKTGVGQVQFWFLLRLRAGRKPALPERGEFRDWAPRPFDAVVAGAADFRKPVYARLLARFGATLAGTGMSAR